jgi:hypothetical protein
MESHSTGELGEVYRLTRVIRRSPQGGAVIVNLKAPEGYEVTKMPRDRLMRLIGHGKRPGQ